MDLLLILLLLLIIIIILGWTLCPPGILILGWWCSISRADTKRTLDSFPIVTVLFYARLILPILLFTHANRCPPLLLTPSSHISGSSTLLSPLYTKSPTLPPAWYRALVIPHSLAAPPAPLDAGDACPVGGSEPSLTACIQRAPGNAWLAAPDYSQPGSL